MGTLKNSSRVDWSDYPERPGIRALKYMGFRCFDAEETRAFYEDFLGLEFSAALPFPTTLNGEEVEGLQLLFRMADGDYLSFFDVPGRIDRENPDQFMPLGPMELHIGMKVSSEADMLNWQERLLGRDAMVLGPMDHDMVQSIYFRDPNGLWLEVTYEVDDHEEIMARERKDSTPRLEEWTKISAVRKEQFRNTRHYAA